MSFNHLIGAFPYASVWLAYKEACFEFPLLVKQDKRTVGSEKIHKNDTRYKSLLKRVKGMHIKDALQPFLDAAKIRKDLIFCEALHFRFCAAAGTNMFLKQDAAIWVAPGFYEADQEACCWVMKHEISHIKYNDAFTTYCISGICQLAASIFGMCFLSLPAALGLSVTIGCISYYLFSNWRKGKADDFAIENSSDEELKGGRRFLMAAQEMNTENRGTFRTKFLISPVPSIPSRIKKIENTLRERQVKIDEVTERQKLNNVKSYMVNKKQEIERAKVD